MSVIPPRLTVASIAAMSPKQLLDAELALHVRFTKLDADERRTKGSKYILMRGSVELVDAWDQWGRLTRAALARSLTPLKLAAQGVRSGRG